jgi:uncharacterized membrane protein
MKAEQMASEDYLFPLRIVLFLCSRLTPDSRICLTLSLSSNSPDGLSRNLEVQYRVYERAWHRCHCWATRIQSTSLQIISPPSILICYSHLLHFSVQVFQMLYVFTFSARATFPTGLIHVYIVVCIIYDEEYKLWSFLLWKGLQPITYISSFSCSY